MEKGEKLKKDGCRNTFYALLVLNMIVTALIFIAPNFTHRGGGRTYCQEAVKCGKCVNEMKECHYYNDDMTISNDTIRCECEVENEK